MRKNLRQIEKQNSTELILNELELILKGKEKYRRRTDQDFLPAGPGEREEY